MNDVLYDDIGPCDECHEITPRACIGGAFWCRPCDDYLASIPGPTDEDYANMDEEHRRYNY